MTDIILILSVIAVFLGALWARQTARQRATLDMIEKVESTDHYRALNDIFSHHRRTGRFDNLHNPVEQKDRDDRAAVLDYLNHYELVSIGIQKRILDEGIYKEWMYGPFVRDWNAASDFVQRERWRRNPESGRWEYRGVLFQNFQELATRWAPQEAVQLTDSTSSPPEVAEGPGDEYLPGPSRLDRC